MVVHTGDRFAGDIGEQVGGVAFDIGDFGHRQAGRIDAVDAGGHQPVAVLEVGGQRDEAQFELAVVSRAGEHRT